MLRNAVSHHPGAVRLIVGLLLLFILAAREPSAAQEQELDCSAWTASDQSQRQAFWETVTVADVTRCLARGADANVQVKLSPSAGHIVATELAERTGIDSPPEPLSTPLHSAARFARAPDVLLTLLAAGADIDARDERGRTPLWMAASNDERVAMVRALVDAGADPDTRNADGETLLHRAATLLHLVEITPLVAAGANVNARDANGETPLHKAAQLSGMANPASVGPLIEAGATIDARDADGATPLHAAVHYLGHPSAAASLMLPERTSWYATEPEGHRYTSQRRMFGLQKWLRGCWKQEPTSRPEMKTARRRFTGPHWRSAASIRLQRCWKRGRT